MRPLNRPRVNFNIFTTIKNLGLALAGRSTEFDHIIRSEYNDAGDLVITIPANHTDITSRTFKAVTRRFNRPDHRMKRQPVKINY